MVALAVLSLTSVLASRHLAALAWLARARHAFADAWLVLLVTLSLAASGASPAPPARFSAAAVDGLDTRAAVAEADPLTPTRARALASHRDAPPALEPRSAELAPGGARDAADAPPRSADDTKKAGFDPSSLAPPSSTLLDRASRELGGSASARALRAPRCASLERPRARAPPSAA